MVDRNRVNRYGRNYDRQSDIHRDFVDGNSDHQQQQFEPTDYGRARQSRDYGQQSGYGDNYGQMGGFDAGDDRSDYDDRASIGRRGGRGPRDDRGRNDAYGETGGTYQGGMGRAHYDNDRGRGFSSFNSNDYGGRDFTGGRGHTGAMGVSGYAGGGYSSAGGRYAGTAGHAYGNEDDRGFLDKAGDKIAGWFGADDDGQHRERGHSGRGPANYKRSDERILEDACDRLTDDWGVDASDITVSVQDTEITLEGTVDDRRSKRRAEDCVDRISGVGHVQNNLRVKEMTNTRRDDDPNDHDGMRARNDRTTGTV